MVRLRRFWLLLGVGLWGACAEGGQVVGDSDDDTNSQTDAGESSSGASGTNGGSSGTNPNPNPDPSSSSGLATSSGGGGTSSGGAGCEPDLKINEVQTRGSDHADEFIEIYNASSCEVSFSRYTIVYRSKSNSGEQVIFDGPATIQAGGYAVFGGDRFTGPTAGKLTSGLSDDGQVGLRDHDENRIVDSVAWGDVPNGSLTEGSPAPSPAANRSIARQPDGKDTNNNSVDFRVANNPSPGQPN